MIPKRIPLLLLSIILVGCASSQTAPTKEDRFSNWLLLANEAMNEKDPTAALQAIAEAEKIDPASSELPFMRTRAYHMRKDLTRATEEIHKYIKMRPESSDGQLTLGILLSEMGKTREAMIPLTKAAEDPVYGRAQQAQTTLAILNYRLGEFKESERWIERAINANPGNACVAHYYRGHIRLKESKLKEAVASYEKATQKFCGSFGEGFLALGITYQHLKEYDRARTTYVEIEKRFPNTQVATQALERLRKLP